MPKGIPNGMRKRHQDDVRAKIQASNIIHRLMLCYDGQLQLTSEQISIGKILLNKVLPDLKAIELTGEGGGPVQVVAGLLDEKL